MSTRAHNTEVMCPNCRTWHTSETCFGRWIRNNKALDASNGYCVIDQDYWIHRFRTDRGRDFQLLMLVEIKTMNARPTAAQSDTLHIVNQVMRNRRQTPTKDLQFQAGTAPLQAFSTMSGRPVNVRCFGMHVLRFSGLGPAESETIHWNSTAIDEATLTKILAFDLDPDTLKPLDLRNHHPAKDAPLFGVITGNGTAA